MASFFSPKNILTHLQKYIPRLSERFSNNGVVTGEIIAGSPQVLRITDTGHGLTVGNQVSLIDGKIDNNIISVSLILDPVGGDVLRFETSRPHDLTLDYTAQIELSGFTDASFNGLFNLVAVPSRTLFEISGSVSPVLNGNEVLREEWEIGINDVFTVDRVIDTNTYEIDLTGKPTFEPQTVPQIKRVSQWKMGISVDANRAMATYTKQTDPDSLYLYVIMGDASASKDRNLKSDANQANTSGNPQRILMINTFTILVIFPTENETFGSNASDDAWDEILKLMLAVASGIRFDDFGNTQYVTTLIDHGTAIYNNSVYTHAYTFEYNYEVTQEELFITRFIESRAFRDNAISFNELDDGSNIDLDEE